MGRLPVNPLLMGMYSSACSGLEAFASFVRMASVALEAAARRKRRAAGPHIIPPRDVIIVLFVVSQQPVTKAGCKEVTLTPSLRPRHAGSDGLITGCSSFATQAGGIGCTATQKRHILRSCARLSWD